MASGTTSNPAAREHHHFGMKEKHNYQSFKFKQYADFAQTIIVAATIASTITLSKVYEAPSNSTLGESQVILAWASSLFITAIAASIILVPSAKLEIVSQMLQVQSLVVSLIVLVTFYLLMATPSFRQQYTGPFLLGTVGYLLILILLLYMVAGVILLYVSGRENRLDWWGVHWRRKSLNAGVTQDDQL